MLVMGPGVDGPSGFRNSEPRAWVSGLQSMVLGTSSEDVNPALCNSEPGSSGSGPEVRDSELGDAELSQSDLSNSVTPGSGIASQKLQHVIRDLEDCIRNVRIVNSVIRDLVAQSRSSSWVSKYSVIRNSVVQNLMTW